MKPMIYPTVNLNGTSREALVKQQRDIQQAFLNLKDAIRAAWPHGRDYQTHPDGWQIPTKDAQEAWSERVQALQAMQDDFLNLAVYIATGAMPEQPIDDCEVGVEYFESLKRP